MKHALRILGLTLAVWASWNASSQADEVVLNNGDRLQGTVTRRGNDYVVEHAVLGEVTLPGKDVAKVVRGKAPAPTVTASAPQVAPVAAPAPEGCTRCPVPAEEAKSVRKSPWTYFIGFGISNESGNTEKFGINIDTAASYTWGRNKIRGRLNTFYEEAQGIQTEGRYSANLVYERQISARGKFFALWLLDRDDFADILIRTGWFVGYGYDFVKRENTTLTGKIGGGVIFEHRKSQDAFKTAALLAALDYKHEFRSGDRFEARWYIIPYLDNVELSPMRLELLYAHPLRNHLDITAGFLLDYVPEPPEDIKPHDTKFTFGIRWSL